MPVSAASRKGAECAWGDAARRRRRRASIFNEHRAGHCGRNACPRMACCSLCYSATHSFVNGILNNRSINNKRPFRAVVSSNGMAAGASLTKLKYQKYRARARACVINKLKPAASSIRTSLSSTRRYKGSSARARRQTGRRRAGFRHVKCGIGGWAHNPDNQSCKIF